MYGRKMKKVFDVKKAIRREYGYTPKRKQSISKKWAREAKVKKQPPTLETLKIAESLVKRLDDLERK